MTSDNKSEKMNLLGFIVYGLASDNRPEEMNLLGFRVLGVSGLGFEV